ncbi:MAG: hypothetical protein PHC51_06080 [bacterium]|nr:hypothetical protein [bacterium]
MRLIQLIISQLYDLMYYWRITLRNITKAAPRGALHIFTFITTTYIVFLPLAHSNSFQSDPSQFQYYFIGATPQNTLAFNKFPLLLLIASIADYIFYHCTYLQMFKTVTTQHVLLASEDIAQSCLVTNKIARDAVELTLGRKGASLDKKQKCKHLSSAIKVTLNSIDDLIKKFGQNSRYDYISSNVMIFLGHEGLDGRKTQMVKQGLETKNMYSDFLCLKNESCGWLQVRFESKNSAKKYKMNGNSLLVHKELCRVAPGACNAYYVGKDLLLPNSRNDRPLQFVKINDVNRIDFQGEHRTELQREARELFKGVDILSFICFPLIYADEVVGVLNINSSNYFVGGMNNEDSAIINSIVLPSLDSLSSLVFEWRTLRYGKAI